MDGGRAAGDPTAAAIVNAAVAELVDVGQADFAMESVARRAFFSVGSVYSRWPDREVLIADVAQQRCIPMLDALVHGSTDPEEISHALLEGADAIQTLVLAGECMLAAHTMPAVRESAREVHDHLFGVLREPFGSGMSWYVGTLALGGAMLRLMDIAAPAGWGLPHLIRDAVGAERGDVDTRTPTSRPLKGMAVPDIPLPSREDPVAASLIGAAQSLLAERGPAATTTRHIASTAGVTTGALYRRYEGKSHLLADVLLTQLDPERYAWTWDLIAALASPDPYLAAGDVLADRIVATSGNRREQQILMQVGVAARNDADLRRQVRDRIEAAMQARRDMVGHFVDEDIVRDDVDPVGMAWAFQALPVGIRTYLPLVDGLPEDEVRSAMRSMLLSAARRT